MSVTYYSSDVRGVHLGLLRHLTGSTGAGVEYLAHDGSWRRGRSAGDLVDLDRIQDEEARRIALEQYGLEL